MGIQRLGLQQAQLWNFSVSLLEARLPPTPTRLLPEAERRTPNIVTKGKLEPKTTPYEDFGMLPDGTIDPMWQKGDRSPSERGRRVPVPLTSEDIAAEGRRFAEKHAEERKAIRRGKLSF